MKKKMWRLMDANINRVSEGLRVLEDLARFRYENSLLPEKLKTLRHNVREILDSAALLSARDVQNDHGRIASLGYGSSGDGEKKADERFDELDIVNAGFKRVQEGLRVLEECAKIEAGYFVGKRFEQFRFDSYEIEQLYHNKIWQLKFLRGIYGITDDRCPSGADHVEQIEKMIRCGIRVIQYRVKSKQPLSSGDKERLSLLSDRMRKDGAMFIVNDNIGLAVELGAAGVHLGQEDMAENSIEAVPENMILGISTHNPFQVMRALELGADYIGVGPVFETTTKKDVEKSDGVRFLKWVSMNCHVPYVAIGGIEPERASELRLNGCRIAAMISAISRTENDRELMDLVDIFERRV